MQTTSSTVLAALLLALAATVGMVVLRVAGYPAMLGLAGSRSYVIGTLALLLGYTLVVLRPERRNRDPLRPRVALAFGAAGVLLQVGHLLAERFVRVPAHWNAAFSTGFELATFLAWGVAALQARRLGLGFWASLRTAVWSAMVTMIPLVCAGTLLEFFLAPTPPAVMAGWAEFQRSGWNDLQAFAIANTLDSVCSHLLFAPIVAALLGPGGFALGGLTCRCRLRSADRCPAEGLRGPKLQSQSVSGA